MEVALGIREKIEIYGKDYQTIDGTAVRDYVHVTDLAKAHIDSIEYILRNRKNLIVNLGTGKGFSVKQVYKVAKNISKNNIVFSYSGRRAGDPDSLIANPSLAKSCINWSPAYSDLNTIIESTWDIYNSMKSKII